MTLKYFDNTQDELHIGGCSISNLIERWGTPLYVYDWKIAHEKLARVQKNLPLFDIFYSLKANPSISICTLFRTQAAGVEVVSSGELYIALQAGFTPKNLVFVGPAKSDKELQYAIENDIYAIVVESINELLRIEQIARQYQRRIPILVRINRLGNLVHSSERMTGGQSKFGIDEEKLKDLKDLKLNHVTFLGVHVYAGSQILDEQSLCSEAKHTLDLACDFSSELGFQLKCVDFGGGFGVPYAENEDEFKLETFANCIIDTIEKKSKQYDLCKTRFILELGRYLIAESGVYLTKVIDIKDSRGRKYLLTDGGMNQQIRPTFMKVNHQTLIVNKLNKKATEQVDVVGPCCTPFDLLARGINVPTPEVGDIIGIFNSGAYGFSMSMLNFHSRPWPPEVLIVEETPFLIRRREEVKEVLKGQLNIII